MLNSETFLASLAYSLMGIAVFVATFVLVDLLTPGKLWQEIIEKQNRAVATLAGSVALSIAIIVAAAIHG
jgi:putative membrane protein